MLKIEKDVTLGGEMSVFLYFSVANELAARRRAGRPSEAMYPAQVQLRSPFKDQHFPYRRILSMYHNSPSKAPLSK
jgi:hypothetical protein